MDSLQNILGTKKFSPPDELQAIKDYIERKYKTKCHVKIDKNTIIVSLPSSTLAAVIHLERQQLINACGLTKRLVIRGRR